MSEPDESLEREGYEISNAMEKCPNCFTRLQDRQLGNLTETYCPTCDGIKIISGPTDLW